MQWIFDAHACVHGLKFSVGSSGTRSLERGMCRLLRKFSVKWYRCVASILESSLPCLVWPPCHFKWTICCFRWKHGTDEYMRPRPLAVKESKPLAAGSGAEASDWGLARTGPKSPIGNRYFFLKFVGRVSPRAGGAFSHRETLAELARHVAPLQQQEEGTSKNTSMKTTD